MRRILGGRGFINGVDLTTIAFYGLIYVPVYRVYEYSTVECHSFAATISFLPTCSHNCFNIPAAHSKSLFCRYT